jgi:hypothetical protein
MLFLNARFLLLKGRKKPKNALSMEQRGTLAIEKLVAANHY